MSRVKHISVLICTAILLANAQTVMASSGNVKNNSGFERIIGDELKAVFFETTLIGEYRNFRELTKTYNYSEYHYKDGTTDYKEGDTIEKGRWKIIGGDKVCYKYPESKYYTGTYCFFVYRQDKCYYQYSLANMSLRGPRDWARWSSRAIRKGEGGSCEEAVG